MQLYIFAGPNGCGKSTIINSFLEKNNIPYICPDSIYREHEMDGSFPKYFSVRDKYILCMNEAEELRDCLVKNRHSFCFETVLSRIDKIEFLAKAKENGYRINCVYVAVNSPDICLSRVAKRVKEGGHDVQPKDVVDRYYRSLDNLRFLLGLSDSINIYDNSGSEPKLVFLADENGRFYNKRYINIDWVKKYLTPYL